MSVFQGHQRVRAISRLTNFKFKPDFRVFGRHHNHAMRRNFRDDELYFFSDYAIVRDGASKQFSKIFLCRHSVSPSRAV